MNDLREEQSSDLLTGCDAIAKHLRWTSRQVKHRAASGELPVFRIGRTVCARRSTLAKHFAEQEARALSAGRSGHSAHGEPSGHSTLNDHE